MSDQRPETLDRLLGDVAVGPAPVSEKVAQGQARHALRRRWVVAGSAVAAAVVMSSGALAVQAVSSPDRAGSDQVFPDGTGRVPTSADLAVVGTGRVVIDVPRAWTEDDAFSLCSTTSGDFVGFASPPQCEGVTPTGVSSVLVRPWGPTDLDDFEPAQSVAQVDGYEVLADPVKCAGGQAAICVQRFGIDTLNTSFTVTVRGDDGGRASLDAIRDSLRVLPATQVAVPAPQGYDAAAFAFSVEEAGLQTKTAVAECPQTASCISGVIDISPRPGTVASEGDIVTITVFGLSGE